MVGFLLVGLGGGCGSGAAIVPRGHWGGMTIDVDVSDTGAAVALCCRRATIDQPMVLDTNGRFDVTGIEPLSGKAMHFYGSVRGETMTMRAEIRVTPSSTQWFPISGSETDGHFVLHAGATGTWFHPGGVGACICDSAPAPNP